MTGAEHGFLSFEAVACGFKFSGQSKVKPVIIMFFSPATERDRGIVKENQTTTNLQLIEFKGVVPTLNTALWDRGLIYIRVN